MPKNGNFLKAIILMSALFGVPTAIVVGWANLRTLSPFAWHSDLVIIAEHAEDQTRRHIRTIQSLKDLQLLGVSKDSENNRQAFLRGEELRLYRAMNDVRRVQGKRPIPVPEG